MAATAIRSARLSLLDSRTRCSSRDDDRNDVFANNDPLGLAPDPNPYRYCGNDPVNGIDPSGLAEPSVPSNINYRNIQKAGDGFDGWIWITGDYNQFAGCNDIIAKATQQAAAKIDQAIDVLKNFPDGVGAYATKYDFRPIGKLATADGRAKMLTMLQRVSDAFHSGSTTLEIETTNDGNTKGYVKFWTFLNNTKSGWVIHLTGLFFKVSEDQQVETIYHEMGRFYNSLGEEHTGTWNDVYEWNGIIASLTGHVDDIKTLNGK